MGKIVNDQHLVALCHDTSVAENTASLDITASVVLAQRSTAHYRDYPRCLAEDVYGRENLISVVCSGRWRNYETDKGKKTGKWSLESTLPDSNPLVNRPSDRCSL